MPVEAVQYYNNNTRSQYTLSNVFAGGVIGAAGGLVVRQLVPLSEAESKKIPLRTILISARKNTNSNMVNQFKSLKERSVAQDTFIKMIEDKNFKKSKDIAEALQPPEVAEEFKKIIKVADKDAAASARSIASGYVRMIKGSRPYLGYVAVGTTLGVLGGLLKNVLTQNRDRV